MADMHICDRCGKPTPNYSKYISGPIGDREGYSVCDDCVKQRDRERAWENEQWHEDEIKCPWCGYEDPYSGGFGSEYDEECECANCGKPFIVEKLIKVTYVSKRRIEDMPEGWDGE